MNDKQIAVITGTSRGLGRYLADHFLSLGFIVIGCSRGDKTIQHSNYDHSIVDIGNDAQVRTWTHRIKKQYGHVNVLICNASLVRSALMMTVTPTDELEAMVRINYLGVFFVLREISKLMIRSGSGRIITISSTMTLLHEEGTSVYSATKAAAMETTKVLAKELASRNITCNIIAPGMMLTDSSKALSQSGDWEKRMLNKQIFPRIIDMAEVCHIADFLVSPMSKSITGQVIYVGMVS